MTAFLLDANLSPKTARHLSRNLGLDVIALRGTERDLPDSAIIALAHRLNRVIITLDVDYADHVRGPNRPPVGVVFLDLTNTHRTLAAVNRVLDRFFVHLPPEVELDLALTVVTDDGGYRD